MLTNPIILKECLQTSRQWQTYVVRAALPLLGVTVLLLGTGAIASQYGQDWRAMAGLSRTVFHVALWGQLGAFSLAAFTYCAWTIRVEWRRRTMETLCASPLTPMQIVYGKYIAALTNVFMIALAILPVMGLWYQFAHMPPEIVFGAFAVILGFVFFLSALSLLQSVLAARGKGFYAGLLLFVVPYYVVLVILDVYAWPGMFVLEAAIAPRAMFLLLTDAPPGTLTIEEFAYLSLGIHAGMALVALACAPWLFKRSLERAQGGSVRWYERFRKVLRAKRPRLHMREDPLFWQEKGASARMLRRTPLVAVALGGGFFALAVIAQSWWAFGFAAFWMATSAVGVGLLILMSFLYAVMVAAREKYSGRSEALLLTGRGPLDFFWPKVRMAYLSMWQLILATIPFWWGITLIIGIDTGVGSVTLTAWLFATTCLITALPIVCVTIGLVFGIVARSGPSALLGFLSILLWIGVLTLIMSALERFLGWESALPALLINVLCLLLVLAFVRRWTPVVLGLVLALNIVIILCVFTWIVDSLNDTGPLVFALTTLPACACTFGAWLHLLVRFYEKGMSGQPVRLRER